MARRYARNQRTIGNWVREFAEFMASPVSPGFNFDRYDGEPQSGPESNVWWREHVSPTLPSWQRRSTTRPLLPPNALNGSNLNRRNLCKRNSLFSSALHSA
jgi:hypothetical protein